MAHILKKISHRVAHAFFGMMPRTLKVLAHTASPHPNGPNTLSYQGGSSRSLLRVLQAELLVKATLVGRGQRCLNHIPQRDL